MQLRKAVLQLVPEHTAECSSNSQGFCTWGITLPLVQLLPVSLARPLGGTQWCCCELLQQASCLCIVSLCAAFLAHAMWVGSGLVTGLGNRPGPRSGGCDEGMVAYTLYHLGPSCSSEGKTSQGILSTVQSAAAHTQRVQSLKSAFTGSGWCRHTIPNDKMDQPQHQANFDQQQPFLP